MENKCISCENERRFGSWFCDECYHAKEAAYKEAKELGLNNHYDVIALRDLRLKEWKKQK